VDGSRVRPLVAGDGARGAPRCTVKHLLCGQSLQWITEQRYTSVWFRGTGREEGFVRDDLLVTGRPLHPLLGELRRGHP